MTLALLDAGVVPVLRIGGQQASSKPSSPLQDARAGRATASQPSTDGRSFASEISRRQMKGWRPIRAGRSRRRRRQSPCGFTWTKAGSSSSRRSFDRWARNQGAHRPLQSHPQLERVEGLGVGRAVELHRISTSGFWTESERGWFSKTDGGETHGHLQARAGPSPAPHLSDADACRELGATCSPPGSAAADIPHRISPGIPPARTTAAG